MAKQKHFRTPEQVAFADLMKVSGLKAAELARRMGITPASISRILSGSQNPSVMAMNSLRRIVEDLQREPDLEQPRAIGAMVLRESDTTNLEGREPRPMLEGVQLAPVVSHARAGEEGFDYHDLANQIDERYPTLCKDPNCFWLRVENDSMVTEVKPGDLILLAPNLQPANGRIVGAKLRDEGGVLCKLYHRSGELIRLTSYNPVYPLLEYKADRFVWIYPVYELRRR